MKSSEIIISNVLNKPKQIAELKDRLLNFMLDPNKNICLLEIMFKKCNLDNQSIEEFEVYITDMISDGRVFPKGISGSRLIYYITDSGKRFLNAGGYVQQFNEDFNKELKKVLDKEKNDEKRDLEIISLRASLKHNKSTRIISIIALIISGLSFLYLVIRDLLLKFIK